MYVAGRDHPNRDAAYRFLEKVQAGTIEGCTSAEVLQEILHRYHRLNLPDTAREVYEAIVDLCSVVFPVSKEDTDLAIEILTERKEASVRDALHAAVMRNHGVEWIATFDQGFDSIAGIKRLEL